MVAEQPALSFAGLLRQLRAEVKLTQEELAAAAGVSPRSVSNLERASTAPSTRTPPFCWPARELFVAAAVDVLATRALPRDIAAFTGRQADLARLLAAIDDLAAGGGWWAFTRSTGWPGSARPPLRCTPRTS